jgi:hypothetical protein
MKLPSEVDPSNSPAFLKNRLGCDIGSNGFFFLSLDYKKSLLKKQ